MPPGQPLFNSMSSFIFATGLVGVAVAAVSVMQTPDVVISAQHADQKDQNGKKRPVYQGTEPEYK